MQKSFNDIKEKILNLVCTVEGVNAAMHFAKRGSQQIARVKVDGFLSTEKGIGNNQLEAMENLYLILFHGYNSVLDDFTEYSSLN